MKSSAKQELGANAADTTGWLNFANAGPSMAWAETRAKPINYDLIRRMALTRMPDILKRWLPDGWREGLEWVARNPTRADRPAGSFRVNLRTGCWADFATGDKGGDAISLAAYLDHCTAAQAACNIATMLGMGERP